MKIPIEYIIELGLLRKRNKCASCNKDIDVPNYHIQLCRKCRLDYLDSQSAQEESE